MNGWSEWARPNPPRPASQGRLAAMARQLINRDDMDAFELFDSLRHLRHDDLARLRAMLPEPPRETPHP